MSMDVDTAAARVRRPFKPPRKVPRGLTPKQTRAVQRLINKNVELKHLDTVSASAAYSNVAGISGVPFDIPIGTSDVSRIGDRIKWVGHIKFKLEFVNSLGVGADAYNSIRLCIFQWHPTSTPTANEIFYNGPTGAVDILSQYNHDERQQFSILWDRTFTTVGNNQAATSPGTSIMTTGPRSFKIPLTAKYIPSSPFSPDVQYNGALTGANRLYLFYVTDSAAIPHPTMAFSCKVVFRDG